MSLPKTSIDALACLVKQGRDDTYNLAKRIILFLIRESNQFTREITITLQGGADYTPNEVNWAASQFDDLVNHDPHLWLALIMMGTDFKFSFCCDANDEYAYKFWLARERYSSVAEKIQPTRRGLQSICLDPEANRSLDPPWDSRL